MATNEQIKYLIRTHYSSDATDFKTAALQLAASEAKKGRVKIAQEIRDIINTGTESQKRQILISQKQNDFFESVENVDSLSDIILDNEVEKRIKRILNEYSQKSKLNKFGLSNRRKILLEGNPGTGKTMTARVIASELNLPLYIVQLDKFMTKYMGETSIKLRQIFDFISQYEAVYLFDEFDAIGAERKMSNDVGEVRRILNSFLQFLEKDTSNSIIIAATNNPQMLDYALFRRFDDVIHYSIPDEKEIERILENKLFNLDISVLKDKDVVKIAKGLSHADIVKVCEDALKISLLNNIILDQNLIIEVLNERKRLYNK